MSRPPTCSATCMPEQRVPADHPLRAVRLTLTDEAPCRQSSRRCREPVRPRQGIAPSSRPTGAIAARFAVARCSWTRCHGADRAAHGRAQRLNLLFRWFARAERWMTRSGIPRRACTKMRCVTGLTVGRCRRQRSLMRSRILPSNPVPWPMLPLGRTLLTVDGTRSWKPWIVPA